MALGNDAEVFRQGIDYFAATDKYDYTYLWSWLGIPIIQMPADIIATQEVVWATTPDVIIETGIARGGSMIFLASILEMIGKGKVVGIDIDIRAHNRESIEKHPLSKRVTMIEGSSTAPEILEAVKAEISEGASVMAIFDSNHTRDHVLAELRAYAPMVTKGCYLVVADTILGHFGEDQTPPKRSRVLYKGDEPHAAMNQFLQETDRFEPDPVINGKLIFASSPGGYLICTK